MRIEELKGGEVKMDTNFGVVPYIFKDLCCGVIILCGICFMNL